MTMTLMFSSPLLQHTGKTCHGVIGRAVPGACTKSELDPVKGVCVTLRGSGSELCGRCADRMGASVDIAEKPHLPGPASFRNRHRVLFLGDVESRQKLRYTFPWSALRA